MYDRIAEVYDAVLTEDVHDTWTRFVHEAWQDDPDGVRSVLDVCCGTGLMAERLRALGYRVVGVDGSATMVARARERLGPDVALAAASLPELPVPGGFDAAVSKLSTASTTCRSTCSRRACSRWRAASGRAAGSCSTRTPRR